MDESPDLEVLESQDLVDVVESASPFAPTQVLAGKYRIDRVTGQGGLCVVVAARHLQLDQLVAIKYLQSEPRKNPSVVARFLREARLATKIRSEHAVHIHDIEILPDGTPYIVMDHLAGMDLRKMLEGGALLVKRAVDYILQACDAVAEAHAAGVMHGDLKPENVFLSHKAGGAVIKVLDFGMSTSDAKKCDSARARELACEDRLATPAYLAPEQLAVHSSVDERADVWALGVLLYELVTGTLPFGDAPGEDVCRRIQDRPPAPLSDALPNASEGLEEVLLRCMQKSRDERYQNVAELAVALAPLAPASARPRIEHIARVIGDAGGHVPPLPPAAQMRASLPSTPLASTPPPPFVSAAPPGSPPLSNEGDASWAMPRAGLRPPRGKKVMVVAVLAASVGVVALLRLVASKPSPAEAAPAVTQAAVREKPASEPPPASAAAPPEAPTPLPTPPPPPALPPTPTAAEEAPVALEVRAPPPAPAPAPAPAPRRRTNKVAAPPAASPMGPPAPAPKPASTDPDAVLNPFN